MTSSSRKFRRRDDRPTQSKTSFGSYKDRRRVPGLPAELDQSKNYAIALESDYSVSINEDIDGHRPGHGGIRIDCKAHRAVPVFAVNDQPVAMGEGVIYVSLPAGIHKVEAQEATTHEPILVDISPHKTVGILYINDVAQPHVVFKQKIDGSPFLKTNFHLFNFAVGVALICCLPTGVASLLQMDEAQSQWLLGISIAWILIVLACTPWALKERLRYRKQRWEHRRKWAEPLHPYPWGTTKRGTPVLLGDQPVNIPEIDSGRGALVLDSFAYRHRWQGKLRSPRSEMLSRLWTNPPRIWIDGQEISKSWGTWFYPLNPGQHSLVVEVHGEPENTDSPLQSDSNPVKRRDMEFTIEAGNITVLIAEAHTYYIWRDEEIIEWFQPRLWIESPDKRHPLLDLA